MSYQIPVSHGDGPRHLELFDGYLLGIGAHAPIRYSHCIHLRPPNLKFSDRYGRVQFLGLNFTALLLADAALAALAVAPDYVPGGYWLIVYVSAFEGLIGGRCHIVDSMTLTNDLSSPRVLRGFCGHPCISCRLQRFGRKVRICIPAHWTWLNSRFHRSRIFSRFLGLLFIGVAFGPSLGSLAERLTDNPYVVFYLAFGLHGIVALFAWFIIPESLLPAQMEATRRTGVGESEGHWFSRMFSFLSPLAVFAPLPQKGGVSPQNAFKKDWSLTWLALSFAPESLVVGGVQYWLQYAIGKFNWSAEIVRMPLR